ncbi:hypothetical protein C5167_046096 [Papaver somniferum]|uniref:Uncharacterized protein n=1 Tax=Papaver somniferum TaxID=3469 RepID=A0A4Y7LF39_PAPSO|nr:hypothetical protein C5167_046096 [Papaver somniferum]
MTRRPSNHRHRPLGFSSFARNANLMASKSTKLKQLSSSKSDEKASVNSQDDEIEKGCMKGKGVLSESSSEEESDLRMLLNEQAQDVGLLVIKHVNNFPPELLPPLYNILFNEVAQAAKHEPTYFKFKVYLLITRIYKLNNANQRKGTSNSDSDEPIIYVWPEDEVFHKLSSWTFTFPLRSRPADENYKPMGLVMAL